MVDEAKELERLERLERMVEELVVDVRDMRLILERLLNRKMKRSGKGNVVLGVEDLSKDEVEILAEFFKWLKGKLDEWGGEYNVRNTEGHDKDRGLVILRRETMYEFLDSMAIKFGYNRHSVLGLLADVGVLKYWQTGKKRQYCIAIRIDKPAKAVVSGRFVLVFDRVKELEEEVAEVIRIKERVKSGMVVSEPVVVQDRMEGSFGIDEEGQLEELSLEE